MCLHVNAQCVLDDEFEHLEGKTQSAVHDNAYQYVGLWGGSQFENQQDYPNHLSHSDGADTAPVGEEGDDEDNDQLPGGIHEDNEDKIWMALMCMCINAMHITNSLPCYAIYMLRYLDDVVIVKVDH
jgi:hypothetical protein